MTISIKDLLYRIDQDITEMGYQVVSTGSLYDEKTGHSAPGAIGLNSHDRKGGGIIQLNEKCSAPVKIEALIHEYIHLKDDRLPVFPVKMHSPNFNAVYHKPYIRNIEFLVDIMTCLVLMPSQKMLIELIKNNYNINAILDAYNYLDKCTVLRWLTIIGIFPRHFAWITFEKDQGGKATSNPAIVDNCYYTHKSDPQTFDIEGILNNADSAAAQAVAQGQASDRDIKVDKASIIEKKTAIIEKEEYYCYAYYDKNLKTEIFGDNVPGINTCKEFDRLLVIGWRKKDYDRMNFV